MKLIYLAIELIEETVRHTDHARESIPFLLKKMDCEMNLGKPSEAFNTGFAYLQF